MLHSWTEPVWAEIIFRYWENVFIGNVELGMVHVYPSWTGERKVINYELGELVLGPLTMVDMLAW